MADGSEEALLTRRRTVAAGHGAVEHERASEIQRASRRATAVLDTLGLRRDQQAHDAAHEFEERKRVKKHSTVYMALSSSSNTPLARTYRRFIAAVIVINLVLWVLSTDIEFEKRWHKALYACEATTSVIFLIEYVTRLVIVGERPSASEQPWRYRLRYILKPRMLLDAVATFPFFLELLFSLPLPTATALRVLRLLRILRSESYVAAFRSAYRVLWFNRQILLTTLLLCLFLVVATSCLLYFARPYDAPDFASIGATMYMSVLMLTGNGGPDDGGDSVELPWYTKFVIVLTSLFSVALFAIPASMLTWGFEAEAQRMALVEHKRRTRNSFERDSDSDVISSSSSSSSGRLFRSDGSNSSRSTSSWAEYERVVLGLSGSDSSDSERAAPARLRSRTTVATDADLDRYINQLFEKVDIDESGTITKDEFLNLVDRLRRYTESKRHSSRESEELAEVKSELRELTAQVKKLSFLVAKEQPAPIIASAGSD